MLGLLLMALLILLAPILTPFITASILVYALLYGVNWLAARKVGRLRMPPVLAVPVMMALLFAALLILALTALALNPAPVLEKEIPLPLPQAQTAHTLATPSKMIGSRRQTLGITTRLDVEGIKQRLSGHIDGVALLGWTIVSVTARHMRNNYLNSSLYIQQ